MGRKKRTATTSTHRFISRRIRRGTATAASTTILILSVCSLSSLNLSSSLSSSSSSRSSLCFVSSFLFKNVRPRMVSGAPVQQGKGGSNTMGSGSSSTTSDGSCICACACPCEEALAQQGDSDSLFQRCLNNEQINIASSTTQSSNHSHHHHHRLSVIIIERIVSLLLYGMCVTVTALITYFIVNEIRIMNNKRRSMLLAAGAAATSCSSFSSLHDSKEINDNHDSENQNQIQNQNQNQNNNAVVTTSVTDFGEANEKVVTYSELVQYRLDHYFSKCKWAKPLLLLSFTFVLIILGAFGLAVVTPIVVTSEHDAAEGNLHDTAVHHADLGEALWTAWTYVADPGTHADANGGTLVRLVSFLITIGGMVIFALMIGIVSDFISEKVDDLKNGKARVIESDHTLMLGWSDKSLAIIEQLCLANESEGGGHVVVLANDDKQEMEAKLLHATTTNTINRIDLLGTEVVFRSGNPLLEHELRKVSVATARSIVVLSPPQMDPDEADSLIVRQVLALKAVLKGAGAIAGGGTGSGGAGETADSIAGRSGGGGGGEVHSGTGDNNGADVSGRITTDPITTGADVRGGGGGSTTSIGGGDDGPSGPHIVVEMQDIDNKTLVELVDADDHRVEVVVAHDIIGRLMIQCARQPGLAHVLENLLGFEGDEFYLQEWPELVDCSFLDVTCRFDDAVPVGIKRHRDGIICINPNNEYIIEKHDKILCLAEDNDTYEVNDGTYYNNLLKKLHKEEQQRLKRLKPLNTTTSKIANISSRRNPLTGSGPTDDTSTTRTPSITSSLRSSGCSSPLFRRQSQRRLLLRNRSKQRRGQKEKLLFCGWRRDMADMIRLLDELVVEGSQLWLFNQVPVQERGDLLKDKDQKEELATKNLCIKNAIGSPIVRRNLRVLKAVDENGQFIPNDVMTLDEFDSILILSDSEAADSLSSDSRSLASLLLVQDLQQQIMAEKRAKKQLKWDNNHTAEGEVEARKTSEIEGTDPQCRGEHGRQHSRQRQKQEEDNRHASCSTITTSNITALTSVSSSSEGGIIKAKTNKKANNQRRKKDNGLLNDTSPITNDISSPPSSPALSVVSLTDVVVGEKDGAEDATTSSGSISHPDDDQQHPQQPHHHVVLLERKPSDSSNVGGKGADAGDNNNSSRRQVPLKDTRRTLLLKEQMASCSSFASSCGTKIAMDCCDPIGEILDTRTRGLLQVAGCKGYVMSNHIVSMMLASVAEDRDMNSILGELLSAHGSETKFRDVTYYLDFDDDFEDEDDDDLEPPFCGGGVNNTGDAEQQRSHRALGDEAEDSAPINYRSFWDIALSARQHREVAFGYKPLGMSWTEAANKGLMTNPPNKSSRRLWQKGDMILILALEM